MNDNKTLRLLSELVSINSVNDPANSITPSKECVGFMQRSLEDEGVPCEILENDGVFSTFTRIGEGPPKLLFLAHYDTVPVDPSEWVKPPFQLTVENGKGFGRGTLDDKSNVASIISAISELKETRLSGSLLCAFTGDEEISGLRGAAFVRDMLIQKNEVPSTLINGDGMGEVLILRRRSAFDVSLEVEMRGTDLPRGAEIMKFMTRSDSHHAAYFTPGVDSHCLLEASKFFRKHRDYQVLGVKGGFVKRNVVPSHCEVTYLPCKTTVEEDSQTNLMRALLSLSRVSIPSDFSEFGVIILPNVIRFETDRITVEIDVRAMTNDKTAVESAFQEALANLFPAAKLTIEASASSVNTRVNSSVVKVGMQILQELGREPLCIEREGASDAGHFAGLGIPTIDFGPNGGNMHGPNEYVEIDSLNLLPRFYSRIAGQLLT
jgi:succinyl-diaminopimelate desuccinylase